MSETLQFTSAWENFIIGPPHNRRGVLRHRLGPLNLSVTQFISTNLGPGQVLIGYFQDEASLSLDTWSVRAPLIELRKLLESSRLAEMIKDRPVAHVRRGDYLTAPAAVHTFGSIRPAYYHEAFEQLNSRTQDAVFFTDDPAYVMDTFRVRPEQVVGPGQTSTDLESLLFMSLGKALVIPNSTFSWWAAELMENQNTIIAPQEWFRDDRSEFTLARSSWKKLPN
ncbi:alpha-1,2-fucosyltransferase [Arthrobacter oryzae]|uniref:alpha-1,2-fucosyltransferase n=1 Tax=Arthrobacter oryzae TaxID=409290 RepID=UPI00278344C2|nr:alpha-1,2-fucosyltransferase [Arthrobacter oryzae]MDQ0078491.1 hypothetical protein [Arthrobacter oryzae]